MKSLFLSVLVFLIKFIYLIIQLRVVVFDQVIRSYVFGYEIDPDRGNKAI